MSAKPWNEFIEAQERVRRAEAKSRLRLHDGIIEPSGPSQCPSIDRVGQRKTRVDPQGSFKFRQSAFVLTIGAETQAQHHASPRFACVKSKRLFRMSLGLGNTFFLIRKPVVVGCPPHGPA